MKEEVDGNIHIHTQYRGSQISLKLLWSIYKCFKLRLEFSQIVCGYLHFCVYVHTHLYENISELKVYTSVNRTLASVPIVTFVYLTTSEMRTPRYSGHFWLNSVLISQHA